MSAAKIEFPRVRVWLRTPSWDILTDRCKGEMMFNFGYLEATLLIIVLLIVLVVVAIGTISALGSIRTSLEQWRAQLDALRHVRASRLLVRRHSPAMTPGDVADESYAASKDANIPEQLRQLHNAWLHKAQRWERIYYTLTILSVLFATLVATGDSLRNLFPKDSAWFELTRTAVAIAAALTTGLLAAFNPYKIYEDYIGAWRIVNTAKLEYMMKKDLKLGYLVDQTRVAEESLRESRRYDARVANGTRTAEQRETETAGTGGAKTETPTTAAPTTAAPTTPTAPTPATATSTTTTPTTPTPTPAAPTTATATTPTTATSTNAASRTDSQQTEEEHTESPPATEHVDLERTDVKPTNSESSDGSSKEHSERKGS